MLAPPPPRELASPPRGNPGSATDIVKIMFSDICEGFGNNHQQLMSNYATKMTQTYMESNGNHHFFLRFGLVKHVNNCRCNGHNFCPFQEICHFRITSKKFKGSQQGVSRASRNYFFELFNLVNVKWSYLKEANFCTKMSQFVQRNSVWSIKLNYHS